MALAINALQSEATSDSRSIDEDRPSNSDESTIDWNLSISWSKGVTRSQNGDGVTRLDGASGAEGEAGESLYWERRIGRKARDDEACDESTDFVEVERVVEWLGEGDSTKALRR
jgi:hypothetical protein